MNTSFRPIEKVNTFVESPLLDYSANTSTTNASVADVFSDDCWSLSMAKRLLDLVITIPALILVFPFCLIVALVVKLSSSGPVFFRQTRIGKNGSSFVIYKFRTMRVNDSACGPSVTKAADSRLTSVGRILRRIKVDELPQMINILRGDMSLVGPRPKVPSHQTYVLKCRPGLTGSATLAFRNEEEILHSIPDHLLDTYQIQILMPLKQQMDEHYMQHATLTSDLSLLFKTLFGLGETMDVATLSQFQNSLLSLNSALQRQLVAHPESMRSVHFGNVEMSVAAESMALFTLIE
jgi:lipopolysaccharide/colanic/teichoic acid biosynthesis glycosyltransferase